MFPENDKQRVAALHTYAILDSEPEVDYDEITALAAQICDCPVATVGIVDDHRHWAKSRYGLPRDEKPRELSICTTTICRTDLLIVSDLSRDERFANLPTVTGSPHFRFYCGMPLINSDGFALGTICVMDFKPRDLTFEQTEAVRCLAHQVMAQFELRRRLIELKETHHRLEEAHREVESEKTETERLLLNILPLPIANELRRDGRVIPRFYKCVTILFTDFVGFTSLAEGLEPAQLVEQLHGYFSEFDEIVGNYGLEKLKTIGDAYLCVGGLPEPNRTHAVDVALAALEIREYVNRKNNERTSLKLPRWDVRIGVHSGPVMAGVVGRKKFTYDVWGDAVNVAARMESTGAVGHINLSEYTYNLVKGYFDTKAAGTVDAKNKGPLRAYHLYRIRHEFSEDTEGFRPNITLRELTGVPE